MSISVWQLLPLLVILLWHISFSVVAYQIAPKAGLNKWFWSLVPLVPLFGWLFPLLFVMKLLAKILEEIKHKGEVENA